MLEDFVRLVLNLPPSQKRIHKDLLHFREELKDWIKDLIPWENERELDLLSLNQEVKWTKHSFEKLLKGRLFSIYHESMLVFGYKDYGKKKKNAVLWVRSRQHEWVYRVKESETELYIDGEFVGKISQDGLLHGGSKKRLLARRNRVSPTQWAVVVWDKTMCYLYDPRKIDRVNPRAFEMVHNWAEKEMLLMMGMSLCPIVLRLNNLN